MAQKFDQTSGQVYIETTSQHESMTEHLVWRSHGKPEKYARWRVEGPGCARLFETALRKSLANINSITIESLERVPSPIGMHLWREIVVAQLDSLRIWKVFSSAYSSEQDETLMRKDGAIFAPSGTFENYLTPLISTSFRWVTILTLSKITCPRTDLLQLSRLTNLGVLTIGIAVDCPDGGPDDRIIRLWSRAAKQSDAFSNLRILNCRYQQNITETSLRHLDSFPSLSLFSYENDDVDAWSWERVALGSGWRTQFNYHNSGLLSLKRSFARSPNMAPYFHKDGWLNVKQNPAEKVEVVPVLHLSLGGDFGTRQNFLSGAKYGTIISFHRIKDHKTVALKSLKRPSQNEEGLQHRNAASKMPKMRASKQKAIDEMLTGFGS